MAIRMELPNGTVATILRLSIKPSIKHWTWYTRAELAPIYAELDNVRQAWQWASQQLT